MHQMFLYLIMKESTNPTYIRSKQIFFSFFDLDQDFLLNIAPHLVSQIIYPRPSYNAMLENGKI